MTKTIALAIWTMLILLSAGSALAGYTNFPAGSYIIPMDPCWQPNTDSAINSNFAPTAVCDSDQDDRGIFQSYGLVYEILRNGGKVSWVVNPAKTTQHDLDFIINGVDSAPVVKRDPLSTNPDTDGTAIDPTARTIGWTTSGTNYSEPYDQHVIDYRGGPFVIHQKYLTATIKQIFNKFPHVKVHVAQKAFSAPVDKILDKLPPKIAILGGNNTQILRNYLLAAGLGAAETLVFDEVTPAQISNDILTTPDANGDAYSLFWAPHWVLAEEVPEADQINVMTKLRQFLEAGNSAFLECASIESVEGSENGPTNLNSGKDVWGDAIETQGGWLTAQTPLHWNTATPAGADAPSARLWVNDGSNDKKYVVFEAPSSFLSQCAGWDFVPAGGHVHNYKPHNTSGQYNSTVERFVHDADGAYSGYDPGFDYYAGGRVNGSPDMGYASYLAGHRYIECSASGSEGGSGGTTSTTTSSANEELISVRINGQLPASEDINFRVFYDSVSAPIIANWKADGSGHTNGDDATLMVSLDNMTTSRSLSAMVFDDILLSNMDSSDHAVNQVQVDWSGCATNSGGASGGEYLIKKEATSKTLYCDGNKVSEGTLCNGNNNIALDSAREFEFEILEELVDDQTLNLDFNYTAGGSDYTITLGIAMDRSGATSNKKKLILNLDASDFVNMLGDTRTSFDLSQLQVEIEYGENAHTTFKKIKINKLKMTEQGNSGAVLKSIKGHWSAPTTATCLTLYAVKDPASNAWTVDTTKNAPISLSVPLAAMNSGATAGISDGTIPPTTPPDVVDVSYCDPAWNKTNTCGTRFVLNTVLGLQFTLVTNVYVQSSPIIDQNIMYIGSYEYPTHKGHLQAISILGNSSTKLWDAVDVIPPAGTANPGTPGKTNASRYIFTNNGTTRVGFDINGLPSTSAYLFSALGLTDLTETKAWVNTIRGRSKATATNVAGSGEQAYRLWGIRESGPAIVGGMKLNPTYLHRDRMVYVGADDGMLHAFYAGSYDTSTLAYDNGTGREAWAYIPSTLLSQLKNQNFTDPNMNTRVSVSGSPAVGDFYVDKPDNSGKEWRTILVGTANIDSINQGILFALDVTDPYAPQVLWEKVYPNAGTTYLNMGNSKGVAMGSVAVGDGIRNYLYLTSSYNARLSSGTPSTDSQGNYGINAYAIDMLSGDVAWHFNKDYSVNNNVTETPAIPALLDIDENGNADYLVFGDMDGRLWVLDAKEGKSIKQSNGADAPVYPLAVNGALPYPGPIGSSVALYGNTAIFATGGTEFSSNTAQYGVYATQIFKNGAVNLLWTATDQDPDGNALFATGEKIWSSPQLDKYGNIYVSTGIGHSNTLNASQVNSSGKIHILNKGGALQETIATDSAAVGNIALTDGGAVAVDFTGTAKKLGTPVAATSSGGVNAKVYSWRLR